MDTLERELKYFESHRAEFLERYENQYVVIKGTSLLGTYATFEEAFEAGVEEFGTDAFFIRQVREKDDVAQFPSLTANMLNAYL